MATRTLITTFGALTMMMVVNWKLGLTQSVFKQQKYGEAL